VVEGKVCWDGPPFGLKQDGRVCGGDPPQQVELLVRQRAAGRVVPELEVSAAHFTDAIRELEPDVPGERIGLEGGRVDIEDRRPLLRDPASLSPKTRRPFSPKIIQGYRWCWGQVLQLLPRGREAQLTDLTTGFVADFRTRRRRDGASGPTINRNLTALSAFLRWLERERGLALQRPRLPHEREHPGRDRWLSADEIRALERAKVAP
jgi:hypothetical protein